MEESKTVDSIVSPSSEEKTNSVVALKSRSLYVGNLPYTVSEGDLIKLFSSCGTLTNVQYKWHMVGPQRGQPRGFSFLQFNSEEDAEKAVTTLNGFDWRGRKIVVRYKQEDIRDDSDAFHGVSQKRNRPDSSAPTSTVLSASQSAATGSKAIKSLDDKILALKVWKINVN
jgi:RNA-binding protein 18